METHNTALCPTSPMSAHSARFNHHPSSSPDGTSLSSPSRKPMSPDTLGVLAMWRMISIVLCMAGALYAATFVLSLWSFLTGARHLGYPVSALEYTCTVLPYGERQTCVTQAAVRAVTAGCMVVDAVALAGMAVVAAWYAMMRGKWVSRKAYFLMLVGGRVVAVGVAPGVGVFLRPLEGFDAKQAVLAGGVGVAVLVFEVTAVAILICLLSCIPCLHTRR